MARAPLQPAARRVLVLWLKICAAMIFAMVIIGGVTRLTDSGLSIVEWQPLLGAIPPLSDGAWREAFQKYQQYPEYQKIKQGMTMAEFHAIYWVEYLHRLWGRIIGVVFFVPLAAFWMKGWLVPGLRGRLLLVLFLGGLQGALGWYMVQSGLVDRPDVSQYRLTAHLGLAVAIYGYILWLAWGLAAPRAHKASVHAAGLAAMVFVTMLAGGFVAGLDAGLVYNTFPLMDGRFFPAGYFEDALGWRVVFENIPAVQFNHRWIAITTLFLALLLWWRTRSGAPAMRQAGGLVAVAALVQATLGIATLLLAVPFALGVLHQAGALVLLTAALWAAHSSAR